MTAWCCRGVRRKVRNRPQRQVCLLLLPIDRKAVAAPARRCCRNLMPGVVFMPACMRVQPAARPEYMSAAGLLQYLQHEFCSISMPDSAVCWLS